MQISYAWLGVQESQNYFYFCLTWSAKPLPWTLKSLIGACKIGLAKIHYILPTIFRHTCLPKAVAKYIHHCPLKNKKCKKWSEKATIFQFRYRPDATCIRQAASSKQTCREDWYGQFFP